MQKPVPQEALELFAVTVKHEVQSYLQACEEEQRQPSKVEQLQALIQDARKFLKEHRSNGWDVTAPMLVIAALDAAQKSEEE